MLELLECPVCLSVITRSPVPCCSNGHTLCSPCWTRSHTCPICRVDMHRATKCFSQTANRLVEMLANLPCTNHHLGCSFTSSSDRLAAHEASCDLRPLHAEPEPRCLQAQCRVGRKRSADQVEERTRETCQFCHKHFSKKYFLRSEPSSDVDVFNQREMFRHSCLNGARYTVVMVGSRTGLDTPHT